MDVVFEVLANERRRHLLDYLLATDGSVTLADAADEVAVREFDSSLADVPAEDVKRIYMSLYHTHVPKLAAFGAVVYDQDGDRVALGENTGRLTEYLLDDPEEAPD